MSRIGWCTEASERGPSSSTTTGLESLRALAELAPLHQPPALDAVERCRDAWPDVPNVVCFDTAFHTTIPEAARTYAIPARFRDTVRVYGFHGLSHAWAVSRARVLAPDARRVVVAHLGGGQSLCAALDGRSVMTTMGFTPLDGLVMATRSGALDPGAVLWLVRHTDEDIDAVLESESGLLGLCGDSDMRTIHARIAAGDAEARLAFDVWHHRIVTQIGACVAALGGLDALVFTGAIGEHDQIVRSAVAELARLARRRDRRRPPHRRGPGSRADGTPGVRPQLCRGGARGPAALRRSAPTPRPPPFCAARR